MRGKKKKNYISTVSLLLLPYILLGPNQFLHKAGAFIGLFSVVLAAVILSGQPRWCLLTVLCTGGTRRLSPPP